RVRKDLLGVRRVPLQRQVHDDTRAAPFGGSLGGECDHLIVDRFLRLVEELDEFANAPLVLIALPLALAALVLQLDDETRVQERELSETARELIEAVFGGREDLRVRLEGLLGAGAIGIANRSQRRLRNASTIFLVPDVPLTADLELEPLRNRVDGGDADAVQ